MAPEFSFTARQVLETDIKILNDTIESVEDELAKSKAKSAALSGIVAEKQKIILDKTVQANVLLTEIKAFHDARLAGQSEVDALNASLESEAEDGIVTLQDANSKSPFTSLAARNIADSADKAAWPSTMILHDGITIQGVGGEDDEDGGQQPDYEWQLLPAGTSDDPFSVGNRDCNVKPTQWDGDRYAEVPAVDPTKDEDDQEDLYIVFDGKKLETVIVPDFGCPLDEIVLGSGETRVDKLNFTITGYSLEGDSPTSPIIADLAGDSVGLGTNISYQPDFFVFDKGVNDNGESWTYNGVTYTGDPTTNEFTTDKLSTVDSIKTEIFGTGDSQGLLGDVNAIMEARAKHDLYTWSLEYIQTEEGKKIVKLEDLIGQLGEEPEGTDFGHDTGNIENEVTVQDKYDALTEEQKQSLSEEHGLGYPLFEALTETRIDESTGEEFLAQVYDDLDDGTPSNNPSFGFNTNHVHYDPSEVLKYIENNPSEFIFGDNVATERGSVIIIDSSGNKDTFTGSTPQINHVKSGAMNASNTVADTLTVKDAPISESVPSYYLIPPGAGLGLTYSGSIGIGTTAQWDTVFAKIYYGDLRGSAYKASVGILTAGDSYTYPLMLTGVSTNTSTGIASRTRMYTDPNLNFNPSTGVLSLGSIVVSEIEVTSGAVGAAKSIFINDSDTFPSSIDRGLVGFVTSGIGTFSKFYASTSFSFDPDTEELFATKFIGIGSFTNITSSGITTLGVTTTTDLETQNLNVSGIVTLTDLNVSGITTLGVTTTTDLEAQQLNVSGFSTFSSVKIADNLRIVDDSGTPEIRSDTLRIRDALDTKTKIFFGDSGSGNIVRLYADGIEKLSTNSRGIFVQGTVNANNGINITSGISTLGVTTTTDLEAQSLNVSGVGTFGGIDISNISLANLEVTSIGTITNLNNTHLNSANLINSGIASFTGQQVVDSSEIEILEVLPLILTSLGNAVDPTLDTIIYQTEEYLRTFDNGDLVKYISPSGDSYSGLTDGGVYYIQNVGVGNSIKLYTDSGLSSLIDINDASSASGIHTFRKVSSGIATITTLSSTDGTIDDVLTVSGLATITNAYIGFATANNLILEGPTLAETFNITNFVYDKTTGISTVTVGSDLTFKINDTIRLSGIAFTCDSEHAGVTTTIFPDGTQGFEYTVNQLIDTRNFVTNVGISTIGHNYDTGGVVSFGLNNKFKFPTSDGKSGQYMITDGSGILSFSSPDQLAGNRLYVSSKFGNDLNDGVNGPLKSVKKACELASALSYDNPVTIYVASGNYIEDNPIILPDNTSIVGDGLRRGIIRPKNAKRDLFRVRNACYITNLQFRDNVSFPTETYRNDVLDKAVEYAKILVNGETGTATAYRSISATTSPVVSLASTVSVATRIDELIGLSKDSILSQQTQIPTKSIGNGDQEFIDAGDLIINNLGSSQKTAGSGYIPGNSVGWSTSGSGGNFNLSDIQIAEFESNVFNVLFGIAEDLKYGGLFGNEFTSKRLKNIIVGSPQFTWDFAVAFDDPADPFIDRTNYVGLSSDKPRITQSPYIQNCSIISFLGGNGCNVDGSKIISDNIPLVAGEAENPPIGDVPDQGKSMVANAFTAVTFGGIGWKVSNSGYAQIVSCFQIFCQIGSYAQSGGYLSITNSATNFGIYALRASGFRPQPFDFDKGVIFETGSIENVQTIRVGGLGRSDQELYVLRFILAASGEDKTQDFKIAGITTAISHTGIDSTTNIINIGAVGNSLNDGDGLLYRAPSPQSVIGGLTNDANFYVKLVGTGNTQANLYVDEDLRTLVDITDSPVGVHTFTKVAEEFFVKEIVDKHKVYQNLTLSNVIGTAVTFNQGSSISQVRSDSTVAVGFAVTWTTSKLTVSVEDSTNTAGDNEKLLFQTSSQGGTIGDINGLASDITATETRSDLNTINLKVGSTVQGSSISGISALPRTYKCNLHRPSIVNSSSHTWEYAGSGTDYNALPENGGQTRPEFEQYNENGGRVFTSGTNELGDFKVGDSITAFNRTGNIVFNNTVTIGQLDALQLSLSSGVSITEISISQELGTDEDGGPSDSRLITQKSAYNYLQNHLGPFIDVQKSTGPVPTAIPQLNSQGLLDAGMIPATIRFNNVFETNVSGGRTDLVNQIPANQILKSDIVTETPFNDNFTLVFENESQFLVLSSNTENYQFSDGDEISSSENSAVGIVTAATHVGYGSTGYVRGVLNSISLTNGGNGYNTAGIYTGVNLVSTSGIGTGATADVTVNSSGEVENINLSIGGRYYQPGDSFIIDPDDLGGVDAGFTTFTASVGGIDTRLYLKLTGDKNQFFATQLLPDFIADQRSGTLSTSFTESLSVTFNPQSVSAGGSVFFPENCILLPSGHGFVNGDVVKYNVTAGTAVANLLSGNTYFVKNVGVSSIQLAEDYVGNTIIDLASSGSGSHQLVRSGVSTDRNRINILNHGYTAGNPVRLLASDPPAGSFNNSFYFIGSVSTNGFTLHDVRQDALLSVNGQTFNEVNLTDTGTGTGGFKEQNVTFVSTINTSSNNANNFSILSSSGSIDASSVISGVFGPARLATGTANDEKFLRGDSKWEYAIQTIKVGTGETSALVVNAGTPGGVIAGTGINTYFGNLELSVTGVSTIGIGNTDHSKLGVSRFKFKQNATNFGPFKVTGSDSKVDLQTTIAGTNDNGIDAFTFNGQTLANIVDLSSNTVGGASRNTLRAQNGGTGVNNNSALQGSIFVCTSESPAQFTGSINPTIAGKVGIGFFSTTDTDIKGTIDLDQKVSIDVGETTTSTTAQTSIYTFPKATFRTGKFVISVKDSSQNYYHAAECLITHDDTNAYITIYASLFTNGQLATFTADINGDNVRLLATPTTSNTTTFKISASSLIRV